jgi:protein phosphatase
METNRPETQSPPSGSLQSMLARLRGMVQALTNPSSEEPGKGELLPTWDGGAPVTEPPSSAVVVEAEPAPASLPVAETVEETAPAPAVSETAPPPATTVEPGPAAQLCPACQAPRTEAQIYCSECGWIFPAETTASAPPASDDQPTLLKDRYELGTLLGERAGTRRYRGIDHGTDGATARLVSILASAATPPAEAAASVPHWPSIAWEKALLSRAQHSALPCLIDHFEHNGTEYLVEEMPSGQALWDAWDAPQATAAERYGWLKELATALQQLHELGAILEGLHPGIVIVDHNGRARLTDVSDLLPLPLPPDAPIKATYYTAPELVVGSDKADARADLYSLGAVLYALLLGRELTDLDFVQGSPKPMIERLPDIHPLLGRLLAKTFCREIEMRFPTEEAGLQDGTGFTELIHALDVCARTLDEVRFETAAWTTTGMMRSGNEDGFALVHAAEAREDDLAEAALILLADGMGGQEGGEVAAAVAVQSARQWLLQQPAFAFLSGGKGIGEKDSGVANAEICKLILTAALKEANRQVCEAAKSGNGHHRMGCTMELVYAVGHQFWVAHVGDSRTYQMHGGELRQVTRDQTWVNRMVDLGVLSQKEAEEHPRRSELQQAIGGHGDVEPDIYESRLHAGDWVLVCSDGISNCLDDDTIRDILLHSVSAESAARRLVNTANYLGAMDNATAVVVRIC